MTDPTPETTPTRDEAVPPGWKLVPVEPTEAMMAVGRTCGTNSANTYRAMLASAPAPASGMDAVLNLYREAVRVDVKMEGPQFMGCNTSALKRAWEADRASLAKPASEPAGGVREAQIEAGAKAIRQARVNGITPPEEGTAYDRKLAEACLRALDESTHDR